MAWEGLGQDRISELPDGILSHILCFLPMRDAVQTTILSERWNNLWISIPNLDLDQYEIGRNFEEFVDRLLSKHISSNIQKFRLRSYLDQAIHYYYTREDYVSRNSRWIHDAITHNIVELDLDLFLPGTDYSPRELGEIELPVSLFTCKTLVALKLSSNYLNLTPPPSASAWFPSLKSLYYGLIKRGSTSLFEMLVSKCPVLEDLTVDANILFWDPEYVYTLNILAAGLKRCKILGEDFPYDEDKYSFTIGAPKLEDFVVSVDAGLSNYEFSDDAKALVKAVIHLTHAYREKDDYRADMDIDRVEDAPHLLEQVSGVEYLSLSAPMYSAPSLPFFSNLKHLEVSVFFCSYWEYVMELLQRSPNLEDIVLDIFPRTWNKHEYVQGYRPFHPPEVVPTCVSSQLKSISIINFMGYEDEFDVVKFMLKHSEILRRLSISTCERYLYSTRRMIPEKFYKKALKLQKYSKTCEIEVTISSETQDPMS